MKTWTRAAIALTFAAGVISVGWPAHANSLPAPPVYGVAATVQRQSQKVTYYYHSQQTRKAKERRQRAEEERRQRAEQMRKKASAPSAPQEEGERIHAALPSPALRKALEAAATAPGRLPPASFLRPLVFAAWLTPDDRAWLNRRIEERADKFPGALIQPSVSAVNFTYEGLKPVFQTGELANIKVTAESASEVGRLEGKPIVCTLLGNRIAAGVKGAEFQWIASGTATLECISEQVLDRRLLSAADLPLQ